MSALGQRPERERTANRNDADCDPWAVLEALDDEASRRIVECADTPMTVGELAEACDVPQSTAYRKVDRLREAGLLERTVRLSATGRHPDQYERAIEGVSIAIDGTVEVECLSG